MPDLASALRMPGLYDVQVWVGAGTYYPTTDSVRSESFSLPEGVKVYGGFNGSESNLAQRNWQTNLTILSGNLGDPNSDLDNSYHVVSNAFLMHNTVLDGFTITGGRATGGSETNGGGMYNYFAAPAITNCSFVDNGAAGSGGALYSAGDEDIAKVVNCRFLSNWAGRGGAMHFDASSLQAENCRFERNTAHSGGAIALINPATWSCSIMSSLFVSNAVSGGDGCYGGALFATNARAYLYFVSCTGNAVNLTNGATQGGGALDFQGGADSHYAVGSSLIWCNTATAQGSGGIRLDRQQVVWDAGLVSPQSFANNFIEGLTSVPPEEAYWLLHYNSDRNPSFVDAPTGDFRLNPTSPAVDASGWVYDSLPTVDLDGNPRGVNGGWDLGAFEYQGPPVAGRYRVALTRLTDGGNVIYRLNLLPGTNALPAAYHWEVNASGDFGVSRTCRRFKASPT